MSKVLKGFICVLLSVGACLAQETAPPPADGTEEGQSSPLSSFIPEIAAPDFDARASVGFNYDFLKDPTRVSFDNPKGYIGLNIPLSYAIPQETWTGLTSDLASLFPEGDEFEPTARARQNANTTIRVEVPMLRGVGMFSNVQNFFLKYTNTLGEPRILIQPDLGDQLALVMQGMISVPLEVSLGWETMTFGYAYKVNELVKFAVNLHRHIFRFNLAAKMDIDLLGYMDIDLTESVVETAGEEAGDLASDLLGEIPRQWINYMLSGSASGHYDVEVWSPTFALHVWRFGLTSRLHVNTRAPGHLSAEYVVPFFVNPETFVMKDLGDMDYIMENVDRFLNGETDTVQHTSDTDLEWRMPHGHTLTFDIVPDKFWLSYTKLFGEVQMRLGNIISIGMQPSDTTGADTAAAAPDTVDFDVGVSVDHIIMMHAMFRNAFVNLGIFSMDFRYGEDSDLLEQVYPVTFGGGALMPVLNFGTALGTKLQLLLELDVLPLIALKTGVVYYF
ncbi:MAG: hypothetical protein GF418_12200 [Chitinivibrionales bacterium]|nr:hypothetical protein [Chitinivibrionales bacterium]MBD3396380.1 hypothetical protein [Chitinivibrionales bacterium]